MMDDLELLQAYHATGSEEAFQTVVQRYVDLVYTAALRQVRDPHFAEEITQAVFLVLARKSGSLHAGIVLAGWLFRTTRFVAARAVRDEQRRQRREREAIHMDPCSSTTDSDAGWDAIAPAIDEALAQLGEVDRLAILLRYFQKRDLKEIGLVLGTSQNATAKRISRALEKLRSFLIRRGAVLSVATLGSALLANAVQAAPASLSSATVTTVIASGGATSTLLLVKAAMKSMFYAKLCSAGIPAVALLAAVGVGTLLAQKNADDKTFQLPSPVGQSVIIDIPGLPAGAKKLEFILVPGRGTIKPFLLGKYEVTQGQYEAVMHTNPSTFKKGFDYPVEQLSWLDSKDFCARLQTVLPKDLGAKIHFRLPTDEEWSMAAGLPPEKGRTPQDKHMKIPKVFPWGTEWPPPTNAGNYSDKTSQALLGLPLVPGAYDGFADTSPVGHYPSNQFGLYDMGGNVWEWCEDWIDDEMNIRVVRGAAFFTTSESQIISSCRGYPPILRNFASGFRLRLEEVSPDGQTQMKTAVVQTDAEHRNQFAFKNYSVSNSVTIVLGQDEQGHGLKHVLYEKDGATTIESVRGVMARALDLPENATSMNCYFQIDPTFKQNDLRQVRFEVEYLAPQPGTIALQYDGEGAADAGRYHNAGGPLRLMNSGTWQTVTFQTAGDAVFSNRQSGRADFRLRVKTPVLYVRRVTVTREPPPDEKAPPQFSSSNQVTVLLGQEKPGEDGLLFTTGNSASVQVLEGVPCRYLNRVQEGRMFGSFYFAINPSFKSDGLKNARVEVEYLGNKDTAFRLQFDGMDGDTPRSYQPVLPEGARVMRFGTGADYGFISTPGIWNVATFHITNAVFLNSQRDGADFRIEVVPPDLHVRRITITRETR